MSRIKKKQTLDIVEDSEVATGVGKKEPVPIKETFFSIVETTIATAIFGIIGYQLGGIYVSRMLQSILRS